MICCEWNERKFCTRNFKSPACFHYGFKRIVAGISRLQKTTPPALLVKLVREFDAAEKSEGLLGLGKLLVEQSPVDLQSVRSKIEDIARKRQK